MESFSCRRTLRGHDDDVLSLALWGGFLFRCGVSGCVCVCLCCMHLGKVGGWMDGSRVRVGVLWTWDGVCMCVVG